MRIGILKADTVAPELAACHGDYPDMFRRLLCEPAARCPGLPAPEFLDIDALAGRYPDESACSGYLITGSRHSVYDELAWIPRLAGFVSRALGAGRPVVGICFGHQLIAHYFGGETRRAESGWCVGVHAARVVQRETWMNPPAEEIRLLASHQDQVVRLPPGARLFARGESCPHAGFLLPAGAGRRAGALTLQGHPEFSREYARALLERREATLGQALCRVARASIADDGTDHQTVAGWLLQFIEEGGR